MKALVTGGGGFLGGVIVRMLREQGDQVVSISRGRYAELDSLGVAQVQGDLADQAAVLKAAQGCDIIFHVAAKAGIWGSYDSFYQANVTGTQNILSVCKELCISKLVYTSSPSVVFDGNDVEGGNESLPYPEHFEAFYPQTKAQAEQLVLQANSPQLATVSLRPHLIWGPGDNHLVPRIIAKGKSGRLRRIGNRPCLVDTVYVDNAARAHLQAAERLAPGSVIAGKAYFISNGEPVQLWDMVNRILAAGGVAPVKGSISPKAAYAVGTMCEGIWKLLNLSGEPPMTRFVAKELATAHWFDISAARRDLGYQPQVTLDEGLVRLQKWLAETRPSPFPFL
ncbi:NAD-dependent epimerase/dehydratase family protein [Trichlorobacter lovleyi]|uniref:NAD-dependent epimerase/dehydratase family protein n=1 Tax=Trichlorobacter lovleyi TaxID=313985 RepID=UPI0024803E6B|nr:NAD-dependent epimerase/dehydratase family protein [Trichlorobacter lovleyi]